MQVFPVRQRRNVPDFFLSKGQEINFILLQIIKESFAISVNTCPVELSGWSASLRVSGVKRRIMGCGLEELKGVFSAVIMI